MISLVPHDLNELADMLASAPARTKVIAGGTDLVIQMRQDAQQPNALLFIGEVPELRQIKAGKDRVLIGSAVTMTQIAQATLFSECLQALQEAAGGVGSLQIRNRATIGGNIAGAAPAGDLHGVLCLLGASVIVFDQHQQMSSIPVYDFVTGPGTVRLDTGQIIYGFEIPVKERITHFKKLGYRRKVTIAKINIGMGMKIDQSGLIEEAEVWASAIAPRPVCMGEAARRLVGRHICEAHLADDVSGPVADIILDQNRPSGAYKSRAVRGLAEDVIRMFKAD